MILIFYVNRLAVKPDSKKALIEKQAPAPLKELVMGGRTFSFKIQQLNR